LIPILLFIWSQEAVKKFWSKIWIFHGSKVIERGKYSLFKNGMSNFGGLGRIFETAHIAWRSTLNKKLFKIIQNYSSPFLIAIQYLSFYHTFVKS
jgi:hypothetical protein